MEPDASSIFWLVSRLPCAAASTMQRLRCSSNRQTATDRSVVVIAETLLRPRLLGRPGLLDCARALSLVSLRDDSSAMHWTQRHRVASQGQDPLRRRQQFDQ